MWKSSLKMSEALILSATIQGREVSRIVVKANRFYLMPFK